MKISLFKHLLGGTLYFALLASAASANAKDMTEKQKTAVNQNAVSIQNAWVRPTNKGQEVGAAYMTLISKRDTALVHVNSDVTKNVEIHSMAMQEGVMKMRMLETLPLAAGKPYKLAPGGLHLMMFDLKKPLIEGDQVNFELTFQNKDKIQFKQHVKAMVKTVNDESGDGSSSHEHQHHQHHD